MTWIFFLKFYVISTWTEPLNFHVNYLVIDCTLILHELNHQKFMWIFLHKFYVNSTWIEPPKFHVNYLVFNLCEFDVNWTTKKWCEFSYLISTLILRELNHQNFMSIIWFSISCEIDVNWTTKISRQLHINIYIF